MMIYPLKDLTLLSHIRGLSGSIYGLNIQSDKHAKKLSKYLGIPRYKHYKSPHLRRLYYEKPSSKKINFVPKHSNAESHMVKVVRVKTVLDKFYVFGERLKQLVEMQSLRSTTTHNYKFIRKLIGLPCNGQRSKTNAQTAKKYCRALLKKFPQKIRAYTKMLRKICQHQSKDVAQFAQTLKTQREEMMKLRVIRELQGMRRYRHKSSQDPTLHYETLYTQMKNKKRI